MKKAILFFLFGILLVSISGCNTIAGFGKDIDPFWQQAKQADDWLQKNAW